MKMDKFCMMFFVIVASIFFISGSASAQTPGDCIECSSCTMFEMWKFICTFIGQICTMQGMPDDFCLEQRGICEDNIDDLVTECRRICKNDCNEPEEPENCNGGAPDEKCEAGENCPADASGCDDNICMEPTCTNGCGETPVPEGGIDEACNGSVGCTTPPCSCDGHGNCATVPTPGCHGHGNPDWLEYHTIPTILAKEKGCTGDCGTEYLVELRNESHADCGDLAWVWLKDGRDMDIDKCYTAGVIENSAPCGPVVDIQPEDIPCPVCDGQMEECANSACEAANTIVPCACGLDGATEAYPWCCAADSAVFSKDSTQADCKESPSCKDGNGEECKIEITFNKNGIYCRGDIMVATFKFYEDGALTKLDSYDLIYYNDDCEKYNTPECGPHRDDLAEISIGVYETGGIAAMYHGEPSVMGLGKRIMNITAEFGNCKEEATTDYTIYEEGSDECKPEDPDDGDPDKSCTEQGGHFCTSPKTCPPGGSIVHIGTGICCIVDCVGEDEEPPEDEYGCSDQETKDDCLDHEGGSSDDECSTCECSGADYKKITCNGDTVYVDCQRDKCWTPSRKEKAWAGAVSDCKNLNYGGMSWVLPDKETLYLSCTSDACSGACFDGDGTAGVYWSSEESQSDDTQAEIVKFSNCDGIVDSAAKIFRRNVRCVSTDGGTNPTDPVKCYWDEETDSCRVFDSTRQECSDPDKKDKTVVGTTYGFDEHATGDKKRIRYKKEDTCDSTKKVTEYFCKDDYHFDSEDMTCSTGTVCDDGACVTDPSNIECEDAGGKCKGFWNPCNSTEFESEHKCAWLYVCCMPESGGGGEWCNDDDTTTAHPNGKNYGLKGTCTDSRGAFKQDRCHDGKLVEYYCIGTGCGSDIYHHECPTGQKCENGACVASGSGTCSETDDGKDYYESGVTTLSDGTKLEDHCMTGAYEKHVMEYWCTADGHGMGNFACPDGCENGACKSGGGEWCEDTDGGENYNKYGECTDSAGGWGGDSCYNGKLYENYCYNDACAVDGSGYTCPTGQKCENGACKSSDGKWCEDTDGGENYNKYGECTDSAGGWGGDSCYNGKLYENYCYNDACAVDGSGYTCPTGQKCENGACVDDAGSGTCTEYGGGNGDHYNKGYIILSDGTKLEDHCMTGAYEKHVMEYWCTADGHGQGNFACPDGCENGACKLIVY